MVKTFKVYLGSNMELAFLPGSPSSVPLGCEASSPSASMSQFNSTSSTSSSPGSRSHFNSSSSTNSDELLLLLPQQRSRSVSSSACTSPTSPSMSSSCWSPPPTHEMIKYSCVHCQTNLARHEDLISKSFQGSQGRAYLFQNVVNVKCGRAEERLLLTGLHSVCDISCQSCRTVLGWKYERAYQPSQKYKEGKYIIEFAHLMKDNCWEVATSTEQQWQHQQSKSRCVSMSSPTSVGASSAMFTWDRL